MPRNGHGGGADDDRGSICGGCDSAVAAAHGATRSVGHTAPMGFDPTRTHKRTRFDYFYVAASVIVCVALVAWAIFS